MEKNILPPPKNSPKPGDKLFQLFLLFLNTFYKKLSPLNCLRKFSGVFKKDVQISCNNPPKTGFAKMIFFVFFSTIFKTFLKRFRGNTFFSEKISFKALLLYNQFNILMTLSTYR